MVKAGKHPIPYYFLTLVGQSLQLLLIYFKINLDTVTKLVMAADLFLGLRLIRKE